MGVPKNIAKYGGLTAVFGLLLLVPQDFALAFSISEWVRTIVYDVITAFGVLVLWIGGTLLDTTIQYLIVDMGKQLNGPFGQGVRASWTLIRDLFNMVFIFALIYLGIKTILNAEDSGTRRALGHLIAAALLINFSLFITQTITDLSNYMAVEIYQGLVGSDVDPKNASIFSRFLGAAGLSSWLDPKGIQPMNGMSFGSFIFFSFFMLFFFVVAGFAFLWGGVLVITRFVALILYMVFSPLMFAGWILPQFSDMTHKWVNGFFKYAFFGPVYMFMLYMSLRIFAELMRGKTGVTSFSASLNPDSMGNFVTLCMYFAIMIGLLIASLRIGDKLSIAGSKMAIGGFNNMSRRAAGFGYRWTGGWAASGLQKGYDYMDRKSESGKNRFSRSAATLGTLAMGGEAGRGVLVKGTEYSPSKFNQEALNKQRTSRKARVARSNRLDTIGGDISLNIGGASDAQLAELMQNSGTREKILAHAHKLKPARLDALKKHDKFKDDDSLLGEIDSKVKETLIKQAKDPVGAKEIIKNYREDPTKLPKEVWESLGDNPYLANELADRSMLNKLAKLSPKERGMIMGSIMRHGSENIKREMTEYINNDNIGKSFKNYS